MGLVLLQVHHLNLQVVMMRMIPENQKEGQDQDQGQERGKTRDRAQNPSIQVVMNKRQMGLCPSPGSLGTQRTDVNFIINITKSMNDYCLCFTV